jgi:hypothetical protein
MPDNNPETSLNLKRSEKAIKASIPTLTDLIEAVDSMSYPRTVGEQIRIFDTLEQEIPVTVEAAHYISGLACNQLSDWLNNHPDPDGLLRRLQNACYNVFEESKKLTGTWTAFPAGFYVSALVWAAQAETRTPGRMESVQKILRLVFSRV